MKLDNTPIGMEERLEIQRMSLSDQDVIKGNNEIAMNVNKSASSAADNSKSVSLSLSRILISQLFLNPILR